MIVLAAVVRSKMSVYPSPETYKHICSYCVRWFETIPVATQHIDDYLDNTSMSNRLGRLCSDHTYFECRNKTQDTAQLIARRIRDVGGTFLL